MPKTVINSFPRFERQISDFVEEKDILYVSEMFFDTIQGENFTGVPAAFLRLQGCTLYCKWCDTREVWKEGNPYTVHELLDLMEHSGMTDKLLAGQHLILTGGSPLKQQLQLESFILGFEERYKTLPFIEIENECTLEPSTFMKSVVNVWNNSPKLSNSGNSTAFRYKPGLIKLLSSLSDSWFKFVISKKSDWDEIESDFINKSLIEKNQVVLMPMGGTQEELNQTRELAVELAIEKGVRFTDRLHVTVWDKKTGV